MGIDEIMITLDLCIWDSHGYISTEEGLAIPPPTNRLRPMMFMKHVEDMDLIRSFDILS